MSLMGVLMLVGIAASNSILIVDFAHRLREQGMSVNDAVITSCRVRLRPILMTSLATILGMIPMALKLGTGAEQYAPDGAGHHRRSERLRPFDDLYRSSRIRSYLSAQGDGSIKCVDMTLVIILTLWAGSMAFGAQVRRAHAAAARFPASPKPHRPRFPPRPRRQVRPFLLCRRPPPWRYKTIRRLRRRSKPRRLPASASPNRKRPTTRLSTAKSPAAQGLAQSRLGAGALSASQLFNRFGQGLQVTQLVTDFGRTKNLVAQSQFQAQAADQNTQATVYDTVLGSQSRIFWRSASAGLRHGRQ